jgi:hypothetical protein
VTRLWSSTRFRNVLVMRLGLLRLGLLRLGLLKWVVLLLRLRVELRVPIAAVNWDPGTHGIMPRGVRRRRSPGPLHLDGRLRGRERVLVLTGRSVPASNLSRNS